MRFLVYPDGSLEVEAENIVKEAESAFNEMRYLAAFAILHGIVDFLMIRLYQEFQMQKEGKPSNDYTEYDKLSFSGTLRNLVGAGLIFDQSKEHQTLLNFETRNKIEHRTFLQLPILPLELKDHLPLKLGISKREVDRASREGKEMLGFLNMKYAELKSQNTT